LSSRIRAVGRIGEVFNVPPNDDDIIGFNPKATPTPQEPTQTAVPPVVSTDNPAPAATNPAPAPAETNPTLADYLTPLPPHVVAFADDEKACLLAYFYHIIATLLHYAKISSEELSQLASGDVDMARTRLAQHWGNIHPNPQQAKTVACHLRAATVVRGYADAEINNALDVLCVQALKSATSETLAAHLEPDAIYNDPRWSLGLVMQLWDRLQPGIELPMAKTPVAGFYRGIPSVQNSDAQTVTPAQLDILTTVFKLLESQLYAHPQFGDALDKELMMRRAGSRAPMNAAEHRDLILKLLTRPDAPWRKTIMPNDYASFVAILQPHLSDPTLDRALNQAMGRGWGTMKQTVQACQTTLCYLIGERPVEYRQLYERLGLFAAATTDYRRECFTPEEIQYLKYWLALAVRGYARYLRDHSKWPNSKSDQIRDRVEKVTRPQLKRAIEDALTLSMLSITADRTLLVMAITATKVLAAQTALDSILEEVKPNACNYESVGNDCGWYDSIRNLEFQYPDLVEGLVKKLDGELKATPPPPVDVATDPLIVAAIVASVTPLDRLCNVLSVATKGPSATKIQQALTKATELKAELLTMLELKDLPK
jgi:hypothetical protein